jgi:GT2 family glycosyltransferase
VDRQFGRLGDILRQRGMQVFNLSPTSHLTAFPKLALEEFTRITGASALECNNNAGVGVPIRLADTRARACQGSRAADAKRQADALASVVIVSHNEGCHLRRTVESLLPGLPGGGKIVVVDDASTDGSTEELRDLAAVVLLRSEQRLGVARARNLGGRHAGARILVFSDAHVQAPPDWAAPLTNLLEDPTIGAVGPVISNMRDRTLKGYGLRFCGPSLSWKYLGFQGPNPHPVPLLGGGFIALRSDVFDTVRGFDEGMVLYGIEDAEMSLRLWLLGYQCMLVPSVDVAHLFRTKEDIPEYQRDWETVLHNQLRMATIHLNAERFKLLVKCRADNAVFPAALTRLITSDVWARRSEIRAQRRFDDDWFFHKFGME